MLICPFRAAAARRAPEAGYLIQACQCLCYLSLVPRVAPAASKSMSAVEVVAEAGVAAEAAVGQPPEEAAVEDSSRGFAVTDPFD